LFRFLKRTPEHHAGGEDTTRAALLRILELNKEMARATRPELLPDRILDAAIELAGAERGFLIQRSSATTNGATKAEPEPAAAVDDNDEDAPAQGWDVIAARNIDRENVKKALRKVSRSITSQVLESGVPFRSDDAVNDDALAPRASIAELKLRSVLCVPMRVGDEIRGCLYVDNRFAQGQFDDKRAKSCSRPSPTRRRSRSNACACLEENLRVCRDPRDQERRAEERAARTVARARLAVRGLRAERPRTAPRVPVDRWPRPRDHGDAHGARPHHRRRFPGALVGRERHGQGARRARAARERPAARPHVRRRQLRRARRRACSRASCSARSRAPTPARSRIARA
jgi:hypothetical protein